MAASSHCATLIACLGVLGTLSGCGGEVDAAAAFRAGDYARAFELYSTRADAGDADALNALGIHYYLGLGVTRDHARAVRAFEQAALTDHADAQRNLGIMYMNGYGVPRDNQRAYGWFFHAHAGGNRRARPYIRYLADNVTPNAGQQARAWVQRQVRDHLQARAAAAGAAAAPRQ